METIESQKNITEFSVQAFRKICDRMVLNLPETVRKAEANSDARRIGLLRSLHTEVLNYADIAETTTTDETAGAFMLKRQIIENLGKYWRVHSMNLETIIDEFIANAIGWKQ